MKNPLRRVLSPFLALIVLATAGCGPSGRQGSPRAGSAIKVAIGPFLDFAPLHIAYEEGFFTHEDLEVELVPMRRDTDRLAALLQEEVDVTGGILGVNILNAVARGGRLRAVADKGFLDPRECAAQALVVRTALAEEIIGGATTLRGRKVDFIATRMDGFALDTLLTKRQLSLKDVDQVSLPASSRLEAMQSGALDLAFFNEPWLSRVVGGKYGVVLSAEKDLLPGFPFAVLLFGPRFLENDREAASRFLSAYLRGIRQYRLGKTGRNLDLLSSFTGLDRETLERTCWPAVREDGRIMVEGAMRFQGWAFERGYLDRILDAEEFWDPGFLE